MKRKQLKYFKDTNLILKVRNPYINLTSNSVRVSLKHNLNNNLDIHWKLKNVIRGIISYEKT